MERDLFSRFRLTLADADAGGGSGGGGGMTPPEVETGTPPLPGFGARASIYAKVDPKPDSTDTPEGDTTDQTPPAQDQKKSDAPVQDSAPKPEGEGTEGTPQDQEGKKGKTDKRVADAQRMAHTKAEEARREREAREKAEAKLKLAEKYVDFEKLESFDKEQSAKDLDKPLTRRDLEEMKKPPQPDSKADQEAEERAREKYLNDYYGKNPHVKPYVESGEAYGVFLKTAERLGPEASLDEIGEEVAEHFRKVDAERERKIQERLTKSRKHITQGDAPRSGGTPRGEDDEGPFVDDPKDEVSRRAAIRNRAFRPQL